jgi:hypothetical protein
MNGTRYLALFLAACALLASALVAIPIDSAEVPSPGHTANIPDSAPYRLTSGAAGASSTTPRAAATEDQEAALPRLWLGSPIAR